MIGFPAIFVVDAPLHLRALEVYELPRIDFAEAYRAPSAEARELAREGVVRAQHRSSFDGSVNSLARLVFQRKLGRRLAFKMVGG